MLVESSGASTPAASLLERSRDLLGRLRVVRAVDPDRARADQQAGAEPLQARGPAGGRGTGPHGGDGNFERGLAAEHGGGERQVADLMRAGERGSGQQDLAIRIGHSQLLFIQSVDPCATGGEQGRSVRRSDAGDHRVDLVLVGHGDERHAGFRDAGLLRRDLLQRVAEERLVIEAEAGDAADQRSVDDVGRVEASAEPDLDHAGIGGRAREREEGGGRGRLEEAGADVLASVEHLGQQGCERGVVDQPAGDADALVEADQVRAGIDMDAVSGRLQHRA
jgi:hypothetical protein